MIGDMPRPRPQYLHRETTRHGRAVWYFRRDMGPRVRIRAEFGTPEFQAEYESALTGNPVHTKPKVRSGSLRWLYDRYRETSAWTELSMATRRQRENILFHVMAASGGEPYTKVTRKAVEQAKDRRHTTPAQARNFMDAIRGLFRWALEAQHVSVDPTAGVKNPKRKKTVGFPPWTMEDHVAKYEARWAVGTRQRVWLHVLLYIGCRRGDAVLIGRQMVRDGVLTFTTEKGRERELIEVTRRIEPELEATLAQGPTGDLAFVCGERGMPLTKESFGNMFKDACVAAGIPDRSAHGLRKLSASIWAERGATEMELMAMFGWMTPQMAALYTKSARRRRLALNAYDRLSGTPAERPTPAPTNEVRISTGKAQ